MKFKKILSTTFLFGFIFVSNLISLNAQTPKLSGTNWKGIVSFTILNETRYWELSYNFQENGKVSVNTIVTLQGLRPRIEYNMSTKTWETVSDLATTEVLRRSETATYQLKGNLIQMKFHILIKLKLNLIRI